MHEMLELCALCFATKVKHLVLVTCLPLQAVLSPGPHKPRIPCLAAVVRSAAQLTFIRQCNKGDHGSSTALHLYLLSSFLQSRVAFILLQPQP